MFPVICKIGPFSIYSYGVMLAAAVIVCTLLLSRDVSRSRRGQDKKEGMDTEAIFDFVFWSVLGGLLGARVFFVLLNLAFFIDNPKEIIMIQNGGLAWQGGLVAGSVTALWYIKRKKWPLLIILDFVAPYLALGQAIGRIGCFLNGCCYGRPVNWGIYFPVYDAHLHPAQLYATAGLLFVFFVLKGFQNISRTAGCPAGRVFALYLILASLQRFINEFFRADHTALFLGLSIFQIVSLAILAVGAGLFWGVRKK